MVLCFLVFLAYDDTSSSSPIRTRTNGKESERREGVGEFVRMGASSQERSASQNLVIRDL